MATPVAAQEGSTVAGVKQPYKRRHRVYPGPFPTEGHFLNKYQLYSDQGERLLVKNKVCGSKNLLLKYVIGCLFCNGERNFILNNRVLDNILQETTFFLIK